MWLVSTWRHVPSGNGGFYIHRRQSDLVVARFYTMGPRAEYPVNTNEAEWKARSLCAVLNEAEVLANTSFPDTRELRIALDKYIG